MDQETRRLNRICKRKAKQPPQEQGQYLGYNAAAGGHTVKDGKGSIKLAESLTAGVTGLNEVVQFVGGAFE